MLAFEHKTRCHRGKLSERLFFLWHRSICILVKEMIFSVQKNLKQTSIMLANSEEELKKCRYTLKEKDFIISEQRKAGMNGCMF